jgi:hypothetical protein
MQQTGCDAAGSKARGYMRFVAAGLLLAEIRRYYRFTWLVGF